MKIVPAGRVIPCQPQDGDHVAVIRGGALVGFKPFPGRPGGQQARLLRHRTPRPRVIRSVLKTKRGIGRRVELSRFVQFQEGPVNRMTIARNAVAFVVSM